MSAYNPTCVVASIHVMWPPLPMAEFEKVAIAIYITNSILGKEVN